MDAVITKDIVNEIRLQIAEVISAQSTLFKLVSAFPQATKPGFPAVIVMPSENLADYGSTATDRFQFAFNLMVYYPVAKEQDSGKAEEAVGECVGELLRIFTPRGVLTTCDWVTPVPSVWSDVDVGDQPYRTAIVALQCVKYVSNRPSTV